MKSYLLFKQSCSAHVNPFMCREYSFIRFPLFFRKLTAISLKFCNTAAILGADPDRNSSLEHTNMDLDLMSNVFLNQEILSFARGRGWLDALSKRRIIEIFLPDKRDRSSLTCRGEVEKLSGEWSGCSVVCLHGADAPEGEKSTHLPPLRCLHLAHPHPPRKYVK